MSRLPAKARDPRRPATPTLAGPARPNIRSSARGPLLPTEQPPSFHQTPRAPAPSPRAEGAGSPAPPAPAPPPFHREEAEDAF